MKLSPLMFAAALLSFCASQPANSEPDVQRTESRIVDVHYSVNEQALPLDSVEIFVTMDQGAHWQSFGLDDDRQPPVTFHAPHDGRFGFIVVMKNAAGASSAPPAPNTAPLVEVFVDSTQPIVQLHEPRQMESLGHRMLQIRWTAIDSHLTNRPVELLFRKLPSDEWLAIAAEPLANTGRFDWRIPDDLLGSIVIRAVVSDQGGHRVASEHRPVDVLSRTAETASPSAPASSTNRISPQTEKPTIKAKDKAARLVSEALTYRDAGLERDAVGRLREAVKLDPERTDAFCEMGGLLFRMGDPDRALAAFETALRQQPDSRAALRGSALVLQHRKQYAASAEKLQAILRATPSDAESWLRLGDMAVFQGDEILARESYQKATRVDPAAMQTIIDANHRLSLLSNKAGALKAQK